MFLFNTVIINYLNYCRLNIYASFLDMLTNPRQSFFMLFVPIN